MCAFTLPTELTRSAELQQQQPQSTGCVHQARDAINATFEAHLSVNRNRFQYNPALGARQSTYGHPISHAGFWACCSCGEMNNEALAPERCSCCSHVRCSGCSEVFGIEGLLLWGAGAITVMASVTITSLLVDVLVILDLGILGGHGV